MGPNQLIRYPAPEVSAFHTRRRLLRRGMVFVLGSVLGAQSTSNWGAAFREGEALRLAGKFDEALVQYRRAAGAALATKQAAIAEYRIGEVYEQLGDTAAALLWYRHSLERFRQDSTEAAVRRLEITYLDQVKPRQKIVSSLNLPRTKSQYIVPSIDLYVHFDRDKAALAQKGRDQVAELGNALSGTDFQAGRFQIIGHTDKRGSDGYNLDLSERRAATVRAALCAQFKLDPSRFDVQGMGKQQLLMSGDTEDDHRLNRRVEVKWVRE